MVLPLVNITRWLAWRPWSEKESSTGFGAVQFQLTNNAQAESFAKAVLDPRNDKPRKDENEKQFSCRMNGTFSRCNTVSSPKVVMKLYKDWLTPILHSLIQRNHETHERCTHMYVVLKANSNGNAIKTRSAGHHRVFVSRPVLIKQTRNLSVTQSNSELAYEPLHLGEGYAKAPLMYDYHAQTTALLPSIPSISLSKEWEEDGYDYHFLATPPERKGIRNT